MTSGTWTTHAGPERWKRGTLRDTQCASSSVSFSRRRRRCPSLHHPWICGGPGREGRRPASRHHEPHRDEPRGETLQAGSAGRGLKRRVLGGYAADELAAAAGAADPSVLTDPPSSQTPDAHGGPAWGPRSSQREPASPRPI